MLTFAGCRLDVAGRTLSKTGQVQHLEPQAFDVLAYLLMHRDRVVPKEELLDAVWGGQFVTESALTTRIKEIRRVTGDDGQAQAIIATFRGVGYRLVAPVDDAEWTRPATRGLVGRERDLEEIDERLSPGALVTIVGPGGVGKTTLARAVVERAGPRFAEGVVVVDLSVLDDASQLLSVIARAAGIEDSRDTPVAEVLGRRAALLLLDDADDLVAETAELCTTLAGELTIIVTSRERLGLASEQLWPLLPLDIEAARGFLADRARAVAPRGSLAQAGADELDLLADAVDRLPLALEMLASMSAMVSADELSSLVGTRPDLVTHALRNAPVRHRSLERLVDASVSRLGDSQKRALLSLTAFAGPFTAHDATAVISGHDALLSVGELVDRSLVSPHEGTFGAGLKVLRTVRNVAVLRASTTEVDEASRAHADLVLARLALADLELRSEDEGRAARAFELLADEARTAHVWAREQDVGLAVELSAALHLYAYSRLWAEPSRWAEAALDQELRSESSRPEGSVPEALAAVLASQASQEGRFEESLALAQPLLSSGDVRSQGWGLEVVSDVSLYLADFVRARTAAAQLMDLGRDSSDGRRWAIGVTNRGLALAYGGEPAKTLALLDAEDPARSLPIAPSERAWLAFTRGEAMRLLGDSDAAGALEEAADLGDSVGNSFVSGVARSSLATIQRQRGDVRASASTYTALISGFARQGNVTHLSEFLRGSITTLAAMGETEAALTLSVWALDRAPRKLRGPAVEELEAERDLLRAALETAQAQRCQTLGRSLTPTTAAALAVEALGRQTDN